MQQREGTVFNIHYYKVFANVLRPLWGGGKGILSKEITLAFPLRWNRMLPQTTSPARFHIYGALLVKSPEATVKIYTPLTQPRVHNCKKDTFFYIPSGISFFFYWNCEISPCCFTLSFIVGYLWSSAQGVATSCSFCALQASSRDKWLP